MSNFQPSTSPLLGRHPRRTALLAAVCLLFAGLTSAHAADMPQVELTIDYGDGVQKKFTALAWKEKLTVYDTLKLAAAHPRGIKETHSGSGETLFVTSIDDVKNEGVGRNWLFEVNGNKGDKSSGIYELKSGDRVLWRFGKQK